MRVADPENDLGGGVTYLFRPTAPDDVVRYQVEGEAFPRIAINPGTGSIVVGDGTIYPATPLGGGGGGSGIHNDLTGRSTADAHPTSAITGIDEQTQDQIGAHVKSGNSLIGVVYDDAGTGDTTLTVDTAALDERTQDQIGAHVKATGLLAATYDDAGTGDTTISLDTTGLDERIRDTIGAAVASGTYVTATPNDGADTITFDADLTAFDARYPLRSNNLSDIASAPLARYNLHDQVLPGVRAVATTNIVKSAPQTIDGVALIAGDFVLLTGQTAPAENGPWVVAAGAWTRTNDYPAGGQVIGRIVAVTGGTINAGTIWFSTNSAAVTVDTTGTTWVKDGAAFNAATYQPLDADLTNIAGLTATTDNFMVAAGSAWASRTPAQARASLALVIGTNVQAWDADLDAWALKTAPSGTVVGTTDTQTLSNKRRTPRTTTTASSATPTTNTDTTDVVNITALAAAITSMTTNLSGLPVLGDSLLVRIKDNGTARAIAWGASFAAMGVALPTTTVISKQLTVMFIHTGSVWGCVASAQEA